MTALRRARFSPLDRRRCRGCPARDRPLTGSRRGQALQLVEYM
jgi:hypothetical protein